MIERYVTGAWSCMKCTEAGIALTGPAAQEHTRDTGHPTQAVFIMNYLPVPEGTGTLVPQEKP